jgi:hypothetical protein
LKAVEAVHWSCLSLAPSPGLLVRGLFLLVKEVAPNRSNPKKNTFFFGGGWAFRIFRVIQKIVVTSPLKVESSILYP